MAKSSTSTGVVPLITTYSNTKEANDLGIQFKNVVQANVVGNIASNLDLDDGDVTLETIAGEEPQDPTEPIETPVVKKAPLLSDIELVSKTVSYDASGIPSVTAIFNIRNSSGQSVKAVNARVQV